MEQILQAYGFLKETVTAIVMVYKTWKQWFVLLMLWGLFILLQVSFCVRWKFLCGRGVLNRLAGISGVGCCCSWRYSPKSTVASKKKKKKKKKNTQPPVFNWLWLISASNARDNSTPSRDSNQIKAPLPHKDFRQTQTLTTSKRKTIQNRPRIDPEMLPLHSINPFTDEISTMVTPTSTLSQESCKEIH